jgi:small conductance mechanosensitive channel
MLSELLDQLINGLLLFVSYLLIGVLSVLVFALLGQVLGWLIWRLAYYRRRLRGGITEQRSLTMRQLIQSLMNALAVLLGVIFLLGQVTTPTALTTALGLFSAGIGFAARPFISDVLCGIQLLVQDQFAIGEKVEIGDRNVIGVVEEVSLTRTLLRGENGELWTVPNGDVRTIRNFTRGSFSAAHIHLTLPTAQFEEALAVLQEVIADPGPDVLEPPEIISESGQMGASTELMLKVKARHGAAPQVRRRLLARLYEALAAHAIITRASEGAPPTHSDVTNP